MNLAEHIEHTLLKQDATKEMLVKLLEEAKTHNFKGVCVNSGNIAFAKEYLKGWRLAHDVGSCLP